MITIAQFLDNGRINMQLLAQAIRAEVDASERTLIEYMRDFLASRMGAGGEEVLSPEYVLRLLGSLQNDEHNIFIQFCMYQKVFPQTSAQEFKSITMSLEYPMRTTDHITNNNLYLLENLLGLRKGTLCDMART